MQAEPPKLLSAEVAGALQSEYCSKYSTKADNTTMNTDLLLSVQGLLDSLDRTAEQKARTMVAKFLNAVNGSYSVPLVITASHLLGHGDYWMPIDTIAYDLRAHWKALAAAYPGPSGLADQEEDEDHEIHVEIAVNNANDEDDEHDDDIHVEVPVNNANDASDEHDGVKVVASKAAYEFRNDALSSWSPFEVAMAFNLVKSRSKAVIALRLKAGYPGRSGYGHQPRNNMIVPQFYASPCMQPCDTADYAAKLDYAAFALGNFYPYDRELGVLEGSDLWKKYESWVKTQPRGERDKAALAILHNMHVQSLARTESRNASNDARVRRVELRLAKVKRMPHIHSRAQCSGSKSNGGCCVCFVSTFIAKSHTTPVVLPFLFAGRDSAR
jgi:hypothetical protein